MKEMHRVNNKQIIHNIRECNFTCKYCIFIYIYTYIYKINYILHLEIAGLHGPDFLDWARPAWLQSRPEVKKKFLTRARPEIEVEI